jgi:hypothetical protein
MDTHDSSTHADEREQWTTAFAITDDAIDAGFEVLPAAIWLKPDGTYGKRPLLVNGHLGATTDRQEMRQWLVNPPLPLRAEEMVVVAFVPGSGGCGVLDCDIKHHKAGLATLRTLTGEHGNFVHSAWDSPSGGINVLFRKPPGVIYGNHSPWLGIDMRSNNGWVVAPGQYGWRWKGQSSFTTPQPLPETMARQLHPGAIHNGRRATNADTVAFINASPTESTLPAMQRFAEQEAVFTQAAEGSRHDALVRIMGWAFGMTALDARDALARIKADWEVLTAGEGRTDEVDEVAAWVVGQELLKRAKPADPTPVGDYQQATDDDTPSIFIDWQAFAKRDSSQHHWLVEKFWPWGRAMALWAGAKEGKSELVLWCAGCLALGRHPWTGDAIEPVDVAYFDYEMTEDDLEERLSDFGFDLDGLDRLHYALFAPMHPLNLKNGGDQLMDYVHSVNAQAVIFDTFSRVVQGDENDAATVQDFYHHTGVRLKRDGIAYLRLDHAGKDPGKGQRGSSAKRDDVDVIWRQRRTESGVILDCTGASRLSWVGPILNIERHISFQAGHEGEVSYSAPIQVGWLAGVTEKAQELDDVGVPLDATERRAKDLLRAAGKRLGRNTVLGQALKYRRSAPNASRKQDFGGSEAGGEKQGGKQDEPTNLFDP